MLKRIQRVFPIALSLTFAACSGGGGTSALPNLGANASPSSTALATTTTTYSAAVLADAPTAYYHLDDKAPTAADVSGSGLNGAIGSSVSTGASSLVSSSTDTAMSFNATKTSAGIVNVAATSKLEPSNAVSLEAFLRFSSTPANYTVPVGYGSDKAYAPYDLYFMSGKLVAQFNLAQGVLTVTSPSALKTNTSYHVVATFDGTTGRLYLNGALVASASKSGTLAGYSKGYGLSIGDDASFADPAFNGSVDEVAVYAGKALSAAQVSTHYNASIGTAPSPSPTPGQTPTPAPTATPTPGATATPAATPTPVPTQAPTATPAPTMPPTNVATYQGCPVFTAGDYYNAPITSASIDPNSASYISSVIAAGDSYGFYASTGVERPNLANNSTPLLTVQQQVSYHTFPVPYPWQSNYYIEPLSDKHAIVVQTQSCHLYESYGTTFSGSTLSAYSGANWDMTKGFVPMAAGSPSAMASGLSIFAGMVKWEDYQSGAIRHALNWAATAHTVAQYKFVRPASDTDWLTFNGTGLQLPYGAHLRLKASFSTAGMGPQATMVIQAMKTYGIYLADTGSSTNALYFANASDGSNPWNSSDLSALSNVHLSDFDVLTLPAVQTVPGH